MLLNEVSIVSYVTAGNGLFYDQECIMPVPKAQLFTGDGVTNKFICNDIPKMAFIDGIKQTKFTKYNRLISFATAPKANSTIITVPDNALSVLLDSELGEVKTVTAWCQGTGKLLSRNMLTNAVGDILLSLDGVTFYKCIDVAGVTEIYIRCSALPGINSITNIVSQELVLVAPFNTTTIQLNSNGEIAVNLGSPGGLEYYASNV